MLRFCARPARPSLPRARHALSPRPLARRYTTAPPPSSPRGSASALVLGGSVLALGAAAYLFRPDPSRGAPTQATAPLHRSHFTPATVVASTPVGPSTVLLSLQLPPGTWPPTALPSPTSPSEDTDARAPPPPIWSVFLKDADIQVERPYTPLFGAPGPGGVLTFWIKRYAHGEVARWMHARVPGDIVELRGPLPTWTPPPPPPGGQWSDVVLLSGGTGFAPFHQLLHTSLLAADPPPALRNARFTLLHASPAPADLPPPALLRPLLAHAAAHPEQLRVRLFVDAPAPALPPDALPPDAAPTVRRIAADDVRDALLPAGATSEPPPSASGWLARWWHASAPPTPTPPRKDILVLVCGPDPMVAALAGPWGRNFSQGALGGVLAELGYTSDQVRKL